MEKINILYNELQIQEKITNISCKMNHDFIHKQNILFLSILKGSFIFAADLVRKLNFEFDIDFLGISSYRDEKVAGEILIKDTIRRDLKGKHVIILEDILDTGNTVTAVYSMLKKRGVEKVDVSAMFVKTGKYSIPIEVKYPGFFIEDKFVVGYGLDFAGKYRNLPYLGILADDND